MIQIGKILWKSCGKSCRKFLWENPVGKSWEKILGEILQENLVEKSFGKFIPLNAVGNSPYLFPNYF